MHQRIPFFMLPSPHCLTSAIANIENPMIVTWVLVNSITGDCVRRYFAYTFDSLDLAFTRWSRSKLYRSWSCIIRIAIVRGRWWSTWSSRMSRSWRMRINQIGIIRGWNSRLVYWMREIHLVPLCDGRLWLWFWFALYPFTDAIYAKLLSVYG